MISDQRAGIDMLAVHSSNLDRIGYEREAQHLWVRFKRADDRLGSLYRYDDVPYEAFTSLVSAELMGESVGRAFNELIKRGGFAFEKVEG